MMQDTMEAQELELPTAAAADSGALQAVQAQRLHQATQPVQAATIHPMRLLEIAVQQGADLEKIERLMAMAERANRAEAKRAYDAAFAAFKAEAVQVTKTKTRTAGPLRGTKYAGLDDFVNAVTGALSRHGLSSFWRPTKDERDWIEVTCYLRHVGGHEEGVSFGGPPDTADAKNPIQTRASALTYLERYTLKAITGLAEEDDDTDANREDALLDWQAKVEEASTLEDLGSVRGAGTKFFTEKRDVPNYQRFMALVQARYKAIQKDSTNA